MWKTAIISFILMLLAFATNLSISRAMAEDSVNSSSIKQTASKTFDPSAMPVSSAPPGAFPYIALPAGYETSTQPDITEFDQIPFWTGDHLEPVEGKVWSAHISAVQNKTFSQLELSRNIESVVTSLGGGECF
ncbi:hypothetical protein RAC90_09590 [Pantoea sp. CS_6]|uniref:hypothetical protein n=1 Tax=Pantoea sp. CS_6 TaxID=3055795 RepID=UPI0035C193D9